MKNEVNEKRALYQLDTPRELAPVPGLNGLLNFSWEDVSNNRVLKFYRKLKRNGRTFIYELKPFYGFERAESIFRWYSRAYIQFHDLNKRHVFSRAKLVYCCSTGTPYNALKGWIVDHINNEPTDDYPSNLQLITPVENVGRSEVFKLYHKLNPKEKAEANAAVKKVLEVELKLLESKYPNDKPLVYYNLRSYYREVLPDILKSFINKKLINNG